MTPIVSVCVTTYNHKQFIEKCLDSILSQKTTFPFEIIIGDDESSDGTREICQEYARNYPDKIKLLLNSRNDVIYINKKPTGRHNFMQCLNHVKGRYIAVCEGDDFWIDNEKIQKQVNFLEMNHDFSIVFSDVNFINDKTEIIGHSEEYKKNEFIVDDILDGTVMAFASIMFRANIYFPKKLMTEIPYGDWFIQFFCLYEGKGFRFNEKMANYRKHGGGIHSTLKEFEMYRNKIQCFNFFRSFFKKNNIIIKKKLDIKYQNYLFKYFLTANNHKEYFDLVNSIKLLIFISPVTNFFALLFHYITSRKIKFINN